MQIPPNPLAADVHLVNDCDVSLPRVTWPSGDEPLGHKTLYRYQLLVIRHHHPKDAQVKMREP